VAFRKGAAVITGPGAGSGTLYTEQHQPLTIYNMELGYATAMAVGIALSAPAQRVIALEGDGSMIAGMPVLSTIARLQPPNLTVLVLDNGVYGTGSGDETTATSHGTDLAAVARACGMSSDHVLSAADLDGLERALRQAAAAPGPWFVIAPIDRSDAKPTAERPKPAIDIVEAAITFRLAMLARMQ